MKSLRYPFRLAGRLVLAGVYLTVGAACLGAIVLASPRGEGW